MMEQRRTWLVTGVAGFIDSHLLNALLKNNQQVVGLDNFLTGKRKNIEEVLAQCSPEQAQNFTFVEGDIRDLQTCEHVTTGVDYVLHQAALGSIPRSLNDPLTTHDVNVTGFLNMLRAAEQNKVARFVYASSSSVYGDSVELPKVEDHIGNLLSPYAVSKRTNELYGQVFHRCYGIPTVGLRYFNVFGPRQDPDSVYAAVIPRWAQSLLKGAPCYINGDGLNSRDFCYVDNVVQANLKAALMDNSQADGQIFNIACGKTTTLLELYALLKASLGVEQSISPIHRERRAGDILHSLAKIDKAERILGYKPLYFLKEGLEITAAWTREQNA